MRSFLKNIVNISLVLGTCGLASAQQQAGASDVSISGISLSAAGPLKKTAVVSDKINTANRPVAVNTSDDVLKCVISVHNGGNYTRLTTLVVSLPTDVTITANPSGAIVNRTGDQNRFGMPGSLVFDLFNMSPGADVSVEFSFTRSLSGNKIGAWVYSACPDPDPTNNFRSTSY